MSNVTVIPATKKRHGEATPNERRKRKVAGYARVSTDSEEQQTSYEAQVDYYTRFIRTNPDWEFAGVYTDEGISALNTKHREGFNRMVADALDGKIDLIVTKSVSRFARNTVDSLSTIRKLKDRGVEVYFEKENIWSFDGKGELLLTIMSSLAQEESRSISDNVTWGQRKRFADGKVNMAFRSFLGYRRGPDGRPEIVPEEAQTIRLIYKLFMQGYTVNAISKKLMNDGIRTPTGKTVWRNATVISILTNEKYKGDAILQKKFTVDFLNKKMKVNEGEVPQYYVTDSHPAIIDRTEWDLVQVEMERRKARGCHVNSLSPFSSKLFCGDCGSQYGSKVWHSTDKYRRTVWQCNGKYKGDSPCRTPHLYEEEIKTLFIRALSELLADRKTLIEDCRFMRDTLADTGKIDDEIESLTIETETIAIQIQRLIAENASTVMDQDDYNRKYDGFVDRYNAAENRVNDLMKRKETREREAKAMDAFIGELSSVGELPIEYSDALWNALIDKATVYADDRIEFTFKNQATITESI